MSLDIHGCHCYLNVRWRARQHWVPRHALEMLLQLGCDGLQRLNAKKHVKILFDIDSLPTFDPISIIFAWISVCNCCNHTGHVLIQNPCLLLLPDLKLSGSKTQHPEIRESRGYGWLGARTSKTLGLSYFISFQLYFTASVSINLNSSQFTLPRPGKEL